MLGRYNLACLLSDIMTCSDHFNIYSERVPISALEHCRKIKFSVCVNQTLIYTNCECCYA